MNASSGRLKIAKDTLIFTAATLLSQSVSMVLAVYIRRELGPEAMGIWALLQVVLSYINYSSLGIVNAVCRQIPILRGRGGADDKIERIKNLGYTYLNVVATLTSIGLVLWALVFRRSLSEAIFVGLLAIAAVTMLERSIGYLVQILYADKRFAEVSRFRSYSAFVNAGLTFALIKFYHLNGFYLAVVLSFVFDYMYLRFSAGLRFRNYWSLKEMWELLKFGVPICVLAAANTFFFSIDKVTIGKFLGLAPLGIYTLALMAGRYVFMMPNIFQIVILPGTLEKFGSVTDHEGKKRAAVLPGRFMAAYFALFLSGVWIGAPLLCHIFLPKYVSGIPAMKALIFGYAFMAMFTQIGHILLGINRHTWTIPVVLILSGFVWAANSVIASLGGGLTEMAVTMTAAFVLAYVVTAVFAWTPFFRPGEILENLALNLMPLGCAVLWLSVLDRVFFGSTWFSVVWKSLIAAVAWFLVMLLVEKKTGVLASLRELIRAALKKGLRVREEVV